LASPTFLSHMPLYHLGCCNPKRAVLASPTALTLRTMLLFDCCNPKRAVLASPTTINVIAYHTCCVLQSQTGCIGLSDRVLVV
ncbi:MAG TPA: hypothetical protein VHV10_21355, partial [Ktedonobacteraceae bacterium]|nr:hypothetical protein [Ktedonobacteraceae bacterium]